MLRGEIEAHINLSDEYTQSEMTWTFTCRDREEFIRDASKLWDWFLNDPIAKAPPGWNNTKEGPEVEEKENPDEV